MEKIIDIGQYVAIAITWLTENLRPFFDFIKTAGNAGIEGIEWVFVGLPFYVTIGVFVLIAWKYAGKSIAAFTFFGLLLIYGMGFWEETMQSQ